MLGMLQSHLFQLNLQLRLKEIEKSEGLSLQGFFLKDTEGIDRNSLNSN